MIVIHISVLRFSWFWIHNETVNIWTHLIGFLIFMSCFGYIIWSPPREIKSYTEIVPLLVQLISYMVRYITIHPKIQSPNYVVANSKYTFIVFRCVCYLQLYSTLSRAILKLLTNHGGTQIILAFYLPYSELTFR